MTKVYNPPAPEPTKPEQVPQNEMPLVVLRTNPDDDRRRMERYLAGSHTGTGQSY